MPSEPIAVTDRSNLVDLFSAEPLTSYQYGHDFRRRQSSGSLRLQDAEDQSFLSETARENSPMFGMNYGQRNFPLSSVSHSSEYESAITGVTRRKSSSSDVGFAIVSLSNPPRVSLEAFPNEVLTHILSHLPPATLSSMAFVSRRFHSLVTTPHAWRTAFSRYFPGPSYVDGDSALLSKRYELLASDKRYFSRLTALASWRSEYVLRTRLLRSLSRGKPTQSNSLKQRSHVRSISARNGSAVTTYSSQLLYPISHLDGSFGSGKKEPVFIHGAAEQGIASASDVSTAKAASWGLFDHQMFRHFADLYPGEAEFGLGSGNIVGQPNCMDVSQPFGMIYGEGCPQGRSYFISSTEQRGRFLGISDVIAQSRFGVPALNLVNHSVCAVWIAKSTRILRMSGGLVGMFSGSSSGVLTAYSLGPHPSYEKRFDRGQVTARWVLCPGVPIIGIAVDDNFSSDRYAHRRVWIMVLNALGEVFYLTDIPRQPTDLPSSMSPQEIENIAWKTGRSVRWELIELSRRIARPDPFNLGPVDGSYTPRSSSDSMNLDDDQIAAETKEIEKFLALKPKHFRKVCEGWNMRRDLKVDFAGDDRRGAGESVLVVTRGTGEDEKPSIRRFTRAVCSVDLPASKTADMLADDNIAPTIFGSVVIDTGSPTMAPASRASGKLIERGHTPVNTEWRLTDFVFVTRKRIQITASALDMSTYALLAPDEDPLLAMSGTSALSSAMSSPMPHMERSLDAEVPGQRARYFAVGTATGTVFVWNIRSKTSPNAEIINSVSPLRVIQTDSPQVSCVALTSLFLIHGGNDGLVQAWDPLGSSVRPIRTLHSRFSSRARRRLVQAENTARGIGNNYFAAGAICLDPDPTVLRGAVSLGTHVRYWSYSTSAVDEYKSSKRRLRRSPRGSNSLSGGQRFNSSGRGTLHDFIEDEKAEMNRQELADRKERQHLSSRFGIDLLGPDATDEQVMAYAQLLSEESFNTDVLRGRESIASSVVSTSLSDNAKASGSSPGPDEISSSSSPYQGIADDGLEPDIAEAIRLSLLDEPVASYAGFDPSPAIPIKYSNSARSGSRENVSSPVAESSQQQEIDDLELAIQLSLVEEHSREDTSSRSAQEDFPALSPFSHAASGGKGKGRAE